MASVMFSVLNCRLMNKHNIVGPAVETASTPPQSQSSPSRRILVVEDDPDHRRLNQEVLIRYGYRVDVAEDGAVAWEALTTQSYDLMITDNRMPKVTGIELLRRIHGASMPVPVIMATGVLPKWEITQDQGLVPDATLLKPYTVAQLLTAVRTVLHATENADEPTAPPQYGQGQPLPNRLPL